MFLTEDNNFRKIMQRQFGKQLKKGLEKRSNSLADDIDRQSTVK